MFSHIGTMEDSDVQIVCFEPQLLEAYVKLEDSPNPEAVLLDKLTQWFSDQTERYPILGINIYYESANNACYALVTLGTPRPLTDMEEANG